MPNPRSIYHAFMVLTSVGGLLVWERELLMTNGKWLMMNFCWSMAFGAWYKYFLSFNLNATSKNCRIKNLSDLREMCTKVRGIVRTNAHFTVALQRRGAIHRALVRGLLPGAINYAPTPSSGAINYAPTPSSGAINYAPTLLFGWRGLHGYKQKRPHRYVRCGLFLN